MQDKFTRDIVALIAVDAGLTVDKETLPLYCRFARELQAFFFEGEQA